MLKYLLISLTFMTGILCLMMQINMSSQLDSVYERLDRQWDCNSRSCPPSEYRMKTQSNVVEDYFPEYGLIRANVSSC